MMDDNKIVKMEDFKEPIEVIYECKCGSVEFMIQETGYACSNCEHFHSFEDVHGTID